MIDFISYFNKTMSTQSKTMITKINQTWSQIRMGDMPDSVLLFKIRSKCSSIKLNQPCLHEPMQNMIGFHALLGINASTDGINQCGIH